VTAKVIDASAFAAITFQEPEERELAARLSGHELHAPTLLRYEMANVCIKKIRKHAGQRNLILDLFSKSLDTLLEEHDVDHSGIIAFAESFKLSAYDASYLWLARSMDVELVTLDARLEKAAKAVPG
jgi:predicted nucleic acid-binding protein